ncbi:MAG TPA: DUF6265 family protein [Thermoanaerobaculia bacterium]|nr:DUF6265 family protein [Thermoanaerobaculia bacterium]
MRVLLPLVLAAQLTSVQDLSWLSGCWAAVGKERGTEEHWLSPAGGTLLGLSRTVRKGATVAHEFMQIRETANGLVFIARPSGQEEATFTLIESAARRAVFENATHDFPQRVIYTRKGDRLLGRIEGTIGGKEKTIDFPMKRAKCP